MQTDMVINIFKRMKSCGCPADVATYNIMIDCCSIIHSYKSACALVSMMIRDGFSPKAVTFTALMKVITEYLFTISKVCCHCFSRTCYKYSVQYERILHSTDTFQIFLNHRSHSERPIIWWNLTAYCCSFFFIN